MMLFVEGPVYLIGEEAVSHSRRLCSLLHHRLVRKPAGDVPRNAGVRREELRMQWCVSDSNNPPGFVQKQCWCVCVCACVLALLQKPEPLFALQWMVTIAVNAAHCPRIHPLHHSINNTQSVLWKVDGFVLRPHLFTLS